MRIAVLACCLVAVCGCSIASLFGAPVRCDDDVSCPATTVCGADGICVPPGKPAEGEGEPIGEGEGEAIGEGEGEPVGEGEGEGQGEGEGEGEPVGEGEGEGEPVGEGEGEGGPVGEGEGEPVGEGEGEPCEPLLVDLYDAPDGPFGRTFQGPTSDARVIDSQLRILGGGGSGVSYAGSFVAPRDYRGLVFEARFRAEGIDDNSEEFYIAFDGANASVLLAFDGSTINLIARQPSPDFSIFDVEGVPVTGPDVDVQLRFDGAVVTANVDGRVLSLSDDYGDVLGDAVVGITAGCYDACDGWAVFVDEASLWPSCREDPVFGP